MFETMKRGVQFCSKQVDLAVLGGEGNEPVRDGQCLADDFQVTVGQPLLPECLGKGNHPGRPGPRLLRQILQKPDSAIEVADKDLSVCASHMAQRILYRCRGSRPDEARHPQDEHCDYWHTHAFVIHIYPSSPLLHGVAVQMGRNRLCRKRVHPRRHREGVLADRGR